MSTRILIVDDNVANLKLLSFVIQREGWECRTAILAEDALEILKLWRPGIILLDIHLPGMSGLELVRFLRQQSDTLDIPIIAITASAMKGDQDQAMLAGFSAYLTKPIDTRQLIAFLNQFLSQ